MEKKKIQLIMMTAVLTLFALWVGNASSVYAADVPNVNAKAMYRLYNRNSGEHFYTSSSAEKSSVINAGWKDEGIGWYAPVNGDPVYRLYNKHGGEHHYTMKRNERDALIKAGWKSEGVGWYSDKTKGVPLYRQYNPHAFSNNHNYTSSVSENNYLVSVGWKPEGIGWYGVSPEKASIEKGKPPVISVTAPQNKPGSYYIDAVPDKIGYSDNRTTDRKVSISINGKSKTYRLGVPIGDDDFESNGFEGIEGSTMYATDINVNDGYKNLVFFIYGDDGIISGYIFAYHGSDTSLIGQTKIYEGTAEEYLNSGSAISGDGRFYLMNSKRLYADPDGQPCFRSYITVKGTKMESHENEITVYHRRTASDRTFTPGCRLTLARSVRYIDNNEASGTFRSGSTLNVIGCRSSNVVTQLEVEYGGRTGWIDGNSTDFKNGFGFG